MIYVTDAEKSRQTDNELINDKKIPGIVLMEQAATAVSKRVLDLNAKTALILCGVGNNGGDGFAVARILKMYNVDATVLIIGNCEKISGDALINYTAIRHLPVTIIELTNIDILKELLKKRFDVIIDAVFGTGLTREVSGLYKEAFLPVNNYSDSYKIAVDIPSGIDSTTGKILDVCIKADETVTFQTLKRGHLFFPGREFCGKTTVSPIGICDLKDEFCLEKSDIRNMLPKRPLNSHKGTFGTLLMIAGSDKYPGAGILASKSALKSGAGIVKLISEKKASDCVLATTPEIITNACDFDSMDMDFLLSQIEMCDGIAIGMGLGNKKDLPKIIESVLLSGKKTLLDADALNLISKHDYLKNLLHENCIITPHPKEMSRLFNLPVSEVLDNPYKTATDFSKKHNASVLLKGATSVITNRKKTCYNITGNSGLSKGGSGDILSGLISSLFVQGLNPFDAACLGSFILGYASEQCICERTVTPSCVIDKFNTII